MTAQITVIAVTYNSAAHIGACLESIAAASSRLEVIVVDNASTDETIAVAQTASLPLTLIRNSDNVGFALAVNQAVAASTAPVIVLINPDCIIPATDLEALVDTLLGDDSIGIVAPTIEHPGGRLAVRSAGYQPTFARMLSHALGLARVPAIARAARGFNLYPAGESDPDTDVEWVSGACFAVRRSTWNEVGGLSTRWFMYAEDIDFCRRVATTGRRIVHSGRARATHVVGASSETASGPVWTLWIENLADYYQHEFRPSRFTFACWKTVTASIYASRAAVYDLRALLTRGSRTAWRREARKFYAYARAVLAA